MTNRLGNALSPYLLQHADNPVDWWQWGDDAFAEAKRRDVPVFLSVGYAACHWCHVMAHESFEDDVTARLLNEHFVNIKVDREERPDVDAIYMDATQAMTGQGGWPMSAFLTPDGEPFFCGTYFPAESREGLPSFQQVIEAVVDAWANQRDELAEHGAKIVQQLRERAVPSGGSYTLAALESAVAKLGAERDPVNGGFGGAPKFPPSMALDFLLRHHRNTGDPGALELVELTCSKMARGGIYDQLGGGFARYSVDAQWVVPHFEKMLYDNALLLDVYTQWWALTEAPLARRIATEVAEFLLGDLVTPEGGFASSLDADTEGQEGRFYVWTPDQLRDALGEADAAWTAEICGVTETGTFELGASVLQLPHDPDNPQRWASVRTRLLESRQRRVIPGRDDKVVGSWNGLAISALVRAGVLFDRADFLDAATACACVLRDVHMDDEGWLRRVSRGGVAGDARGGLDDHAAVALGWLSLLTVGGDASWLYDAGHLLDRVLDDFAGDAGFYDVDRDTAARLAWRPHDPTDNAAPSGAALAADALMTYAAITGSGRHRDAIQLALSATSAIGAQQPRFTGRAWAVAETALSGPLEIAIVGDSAELTRTAVQHSLWGTPVVAGEPDSGLPLLQGRTVLNGKPAAYVCENFSCRRPVTNLTDLRAALVEQDGSPNGSLPLGER